MTKTSAFGLGFCLLSPWGHVFHTAWETMIKSYIILCCIMLWWYCMKCVVVLIHGGWDKLAVILQIKLSDAFYWMKICEFRLKFLSLFLRVQLTIFHIGSDNGLAPTRNQPLSEPIMFRLLMHICITRPQWVILHSAQPECFNINFYMCILLFCMYI